MRIKQRYDTRIVTYYEGVRQKVSTLEASDPWRHNSTRITQATTVTEHTHTHRAGDESAVQDNPTTLLLRWRHYIVKTKASCLRMTRPKHLLEQHQRHLQMVVLAAHRGDAIGAIRGRITQLTKTVKHVTIMPPQVTNVDMSCKAPLKRLQSSRGFS